MISNMIKARDFILNLYEKHTESFIFSPEFLSAMKTFSQPEKDRVLLSLAYEMRDYGKEITLDDPVRDLLEPLFTVNEESSYIHGLSCAVFCRYFVYHNIKDYEHFKSLNDEKLRDIVSKSANRLVEAYSTLKLLLEEKKDVSLETHNQIKNELNRVIENIANLSGGDMYVCIDSSNEDLYSKIYSEIYSHVLKSRK